LTITKTYTAEEKNITRNTKFIDHKNPIKMKHLTLILFSAILLFSCSDGTKKSHMETNGIYEASTDMDMALAKYMPVRLDADLSGLDANEKEVLRLFIEASRIMDTLFWYQAYGERNEFMEKINDLKLRQFAEINYGPWDRLGGNEPFIKGFGDKPAVANFYPADMSKEEFENWAAEDKESLYTMIRRDENGDLVAIPYNVYFGDQLNRAADLLIKASEITDDVQLKTYLISRANAFRTNEYFDSDMAWMDMTDSKFDLVIGPIENYEDRLFGYKAAFEGFVLLKDLEWSKKLDRYVAFLPELQRTLPVPAKYKAEKPGADAQLFVYEALYYGGDCNAGGKTIAINLPNDERVQLEKGARRLQLKNSMKAKFDNILVPISGIVIDEEQSQGINFDAFFYNVMFHEVAHGLGIKNTITGKGPVRTALRDMYSVIEECKADILGLYMVQQLHKKGIIGGNIEDYYTTFMAGIFRSIRFGASSAHGKANLMSFNFFNEMNAFTKDSQTGLYRIDVKAYEAALAELSRQILLIQGDGDYEKGVEFVAKYSVMTDELSNDLKLINESGIPIDIVFEQGPEVLGL
jgi:hypothetical protein